MSMVRYCSECREESCDAFVTQHRHQEEAEKSAEAHAKAHNGHRVSVYREYVPDGGRDHLGRVVQHTLKGKVIWS